MRFGLQKLTLLDYPGVVACTVFTCGCNFRCPFCHNASLVTGRSEDLEFDLPEILTFLKKRQGVLDGICITGGEPLLHQESITLAGEARKLGYKVKLDTNGSVPERLEELISGKKIDYVAMDIKNSPAKYSQSCGSENALNNVQKSVDILMRKQIPYEFRTTVTGNLHDESDFAAIGKWLTGTERYFLQPFADSGDILGGNPDRFAVSDAQMQSFLKTVKLYIPNAEIRGR